MTLTILVTNSPMGISRRMRFIVNDKIDAGTIDVPGFAYGELKAILGSGAGAHPETKVVLKEEF